jgi:hypothetical protein
MIISAAVKQNGHVYWGSPGKERHHDVIHRIATMMKIRPVNGEQGFIDQMGRFYNRIEAGQHALKCGQVIAGHANIRHAFNPRLGLFSEDLW